MATNQRISVIGSGFAGLSAAASLAKSGFEVTVFEKNDSPGGRARKFLKDGFMFDMGPSWYWMPEVFDHFFETFGHSRSDFYELVRLDPSYRVFFEDKSHIDIPAKKEELLSLFESHDPGSSIRLEKFLAEAAYKYRVGMDEYVWKPSASVFEFFDLRILSSIFKMGMLKPVSRLTRAVTKDPKLLQILEFPVLFLGAKPSKTPALYSMMNHADLNLGTWYPMGGMHEIIQGMVSVAEERGVRFRMSEEVDSLRIEKGRVASVTTASGDHPTDIVVGAADYAHIDQKLIREKKYRNYSEEYWDSRTMAPSALLYYVGLDSRVDGLLHHNLFFDRDFTAHAEEIYEDQKWPENPLFYVCCPSKTDPTVAPAGGENLFILIPVAPGLEGDTEELRSRYFDLVCDRIASFTGSDIRKSRRYYRSYSISDFQNDYHAYKGNAYGLANTLRQTAFLKPKYKSKRVRNLYFAGQLTVPVPASRPRSFQDRWLPGRSIENTH